MVLRKYSIRYSIKTKIFLLDTNYFLQSLFVSLYFDIDQLKVLVVVEKDKIHGNSRKSKKLTFLYALYNKLKEFLKWRITSCEDSEKRYTIKYMKDKQMDIIDSGTRSEMLDAERKLVEEDPGPLNKETWAGKNKKDEKTDD